MTETEWATENPAPSKKLVPTWLWFCGGGCLLAVILGVVGVMWGVGKVQEYGNEELQYPRLREEIGFDERPAEWDFMFAVDIPLDMWIFADSRGYAVVIMRINEGDAEETRNQLFNPDFDGSFAGMGGREEMELTSLSVQGREIDMMTYYQASGGGAAGSNAGQAASIDITSPGADGMLIMMLIRQGGADKITGEEVTEVLAPFHVGPDR